MNTANIFGQLFRVGTFGESHGAALGIFLDGCPAGVSWDETLLRQELARRRPGTSDFVSARNEPDEPEILSGVYQGRTLGTPIAILVKNLDARPNDYKEIEVKPRPGHADDTWKEKFGHSDPRGGGRSSGRETLARVIGGAIAKMALRELYPELRIIGYAKAIGSFAISPEAKESAILSRYPYPAEPFAARFPDPDQEPAVASLLRAAKEQGLSYGGIVEIHISGVPSGLGEPVFRKLKADLASACMSVGASSSFEIGTGLDATSREGSQFHSGSNQEVYGGIRGGISAGTPISFRVGFKPTATVLSTAKKGRHDPCIVPRAVPVLEAMTAMVLLDHVLLRRLNRIDVR